MMKKLAAFPSAAGISLLEMLKEAPVRYGARLPFPGIVRIEAKGNTFGFSVEKRP